MASAIAFIEGQCHEHCDGATVRSHAGLPLVSRPIRRDPEEMITGVIIEKIEARVGDRGLGLQTGYVVEVFSCGKAGQREILGGSRYEGVKRHIMEGG